MASNGLLPELFHRRVALLCALAGLAMTPAVARLIYLTTTKGPELRTKAESRLVTRHWEPTIRGKILDRKGRVLAVDRPGFDIAVDYSVISGQWAYQQAGDAARKEIGAAAWRQLSPPQREAAIAKHAERFTKLLDDAWERFAVLAGVPTEEIQQRRDDIVAEVTRRASTVWEAQRRALEDQINEGFELTEEMAYQEVPTARVAAPIREQVTSHVILHDVDDETAFRFPLSTSSKTRPPASADGTSFWMPGLHLIDGTGRDYPFENHIIQIDRSTFPGPLRSSEPIDVRVEGVATNIVGWMRQRALDQDLWWRSRVRELGVIGAGPRRTPSEEELRIWQTERRAADPADAPGSADPGAYLAGDNAGASGIEWSQEQALRGLRGSVLDRLDTGESTRSERTLGRDIKLTIDAALQARVQALMSPEVGLAVVQPWQKNKALPINTPLHGAAVIIEVATGDVLAMVSTPTFSRRTLREEPETVFEASEDMPALNRAIAKPYPPGSIVKPLLYCAAVADGLFDVDRAIACTGHLYPDQPNLFRCWIYKQPPHTTHTAQLGRMLNASDAIMASCNIYFYSVGRALGPERIGAWFERLGCGPNAQQPMLGVGPQFTGIAGRLVKSIEPGPTDELSEEDRAEIGAPEPLRRGTSDRTRQTLSLSEATLMGIGQGPVAWTPLHAANAYATLARGGIHVLPRLMLDAPLITSNLNFNPRAVELALEGLRRSVREDRGTGHHITLENNRREDIFNIPGVEVWGKSGTADSGFRARDENGRALSDEFGRPISVDHAWFVVLVGDQGQRPKYAVSLIVERGGSGGRVSGPLCNQIIKALVDEGYLTSTAASKPLSRASTPTDSTVTP